MNIKPEDFGHAVRGILDVYSRDVVKGINEKAKESMKDLIKKTKATAPVGKRAKHYKSNIASKMGKKSKFGNTYVWYVKGSDYRLSHLLNNGHQLRGGGRYPGTNFITNAYEQVEDEFVRGVEEVVRNGK